MFYLQPNFVPFDNTEFDVYNIIKKKKKVLTCMI